MKRISFFLYALISYAVFFATFLYAIGFLGNFLVPKAIDSPAQGSFGVSLLINCLLLTVFALQHSVMARQGFKRWWTRFVPAPIERATYVLLSSLALILLFWLWKPLGGIVWQVENPAGQAALYALFAAGWLLVLVSTFLINHFDLFGLRQAWVYFRGREYRPLGFQTPGPYKFVRHPLYLGWFLAFWATPTMTAAHLLFAVATTLYMLVAIQLEERDLMDFHRDYCEYRRRVPMLLPIGKKWNLNPGNKERLSKAS